MGFFFFSWGELCLFFDWTIVSLNSKLDVTILDQPNHNPIPYDFAGLLTWVQVELSLCGLLD